MNADVENKYSGNILCLKRKTLLAQGTYTNKHLRNFVASKPNEARRAILSGFTNCAFDFEITN
jgi:hypothetical protein